MAKAEYVVTRMIKSQAVVRFLWDAHNCEEAREEEELVVSTPYIEHWNELIDLWYLGMQVCYNQMTIVKELLWFPFSTSQPRDLQARDTNQMCYLGYSG